MFVAGKLNPNYKVLRYTRRPQIMYYIITYFYKDENLNIGIENALIDQDPLEWLVNNRKSYPDYEYTLLNYKEISKDQYDKYSNWINVDSLRSIFKAVK